MTAYAGGGTLSTATMGAAAGWSSGAGSARGGGADDNAPGMVVTVPIHVDGKKLAEHSVTLTRGEMKRQIANALKPGGDGRRAMGRI